MTETMKHYQTQKEYADELRMKQHELEYMLNYGGEEDVTELRNRIVELQGYLRAFKKELEHYVPEDCPPSMRRRMIQERDFIKYYYLMGFTMDKSAEYMDISRDTVYRIRARLIGK